MKTTPVSVFNKKSKWARTFAPFGHVYECIHGLVDVHIEFIKRRRVDKHHWIGVPLETLDVLLTRAFRLLAFIKSFFVDSEINRNQSDRILSLFPDRKEATRYSKKRRNCHRSQSVPSIPYKRR